MEKLVLRRFRKNSQRHEPSRHRQRSGLRFESLEPRLVLDTGLVISEIMAINDTTIADEDGEYSDWLEIHNPTASEVNLDGWWLTDDENDRAGWRFPDVTIPAAEHLLVFASGKDRSVAGSELHTNFQLSGKGEYLALVGPNGWSIEHEFDPNYPELSNDISYGLTQDVTDLVDKQEEMAYLIPSGPLDPDWNTIGFDASGWEGGIKKATVLITETGSGTPDYFEIQNLSNDLVDTSTWIAVANNAASSLITDVHQLPWAFPAEVAPGEILYRPDAGLDDIFWRSHDKGWLMILDGQGEIVDFVVWGYSIAEIETFEIDVPNLWQDVHLGEAWLGNSASWSTGETAFLQRIGVSDHNDASDWTFANDGTPDEQNEGLEPPFPAGPITGIGFSTDPGQFGGAIETNVAAEMLDVNGSLLVRIPFEVMNPAGHDELILRMKYEDGFVAYLNGQEVARRNAIDPVAWNSTASIDRPNGNAAVYEEIDISPHMSLLQAGTNLLAIHALNDAPDDGDFLIAPQLLGRNNLTLAFMDEPTPGEDNLPAMLNAPVFSHESGLYVDSFQLTLTNSSLNTDIRYTTDGSIPIETSTLYTVPIDVTTPTRIRAKTFKSERRPSLTVSENFIFLDSTVENFDSNLPLIVVDTFGVGVGTALYTPVGSVFVDQGEGDRVDLTDPIDFAGRGGLRIRGSSSTMFPKKQYAFEVWSEHTEDTLAIPAADGDDFAVSLLGMPEESDWIIHGPYSDKTMLRNYLSYTWSNDIGMYAVRTKMVEVFINTGGGKVNYNDDYMGVYVLMEQIKRDPKRVDIAELLPTHNSYPEITGGYIFKVDRGTDYFVSGNGHVFVYVEPKGPNYQGGDTITPAQDAYLQGYISDFEDALGGGNFADPDEGYAKYLDVDSFIDNHILVEMTKNIDGYRLSAFYYKDRDKLDDQGNLIEPGKIKVGPIWDYNLSLGNANYLAGWLSSGWYHEQMTIDYPATRANWYPYWVRLSQDPNFSQSLIDRWGNFRQDEFSTDRLLESVDEAAAIIEEAQARNFAKWPVLGTYVWPNSYIGPTWQAEVDWMKNWLSGRLAWMDSQFPAPVTIDHQGGVVPSGFELTLTGSGTIYYTLDGSDPRQFGGAPAPGALVYSGAPIVLTESAVVTARAYYGNPEWSALGEADFFIGPAANMDNLAITEINYNPHQPTQAELDAGFTDNDDFEFLELKNIGSEAYSLHGLEFVDGVTYTFEPAIGGGTAPQIVLTEVGTSTPDYFEIQNVSPDLVDTTGWLVVANDATNSNINDVHAPLWSFPATVDTGAILTRPDAGADDIFWMPGAEGWLMILDGAGSVVDFVIWGYGAADIAGFGITVGAFSGNPADLAWAGDPIPGSGGIYAILQRMGNSDHDDATDWAFGDTGSPDAQNPGLTIPFVPSEGLFQPGAYLILAKVPDAFRFRYGDQFDVIGPYFGNLDNGGERLILAGGYGTPLFDFRYGDSKDAGWPNRADGRGATLQLEDLATLPGTSVERKAYLEDSDNWRSSSEYLGNPGTTGAPAYQGVIVNEVLTRTDYPLVDAIELYNPTAEYVDIGGWWLSDSSNYYFKFQIPAGTIIPAGGYAVFREGHYDQPGVLLYDQQIEFGGPDPNVDEDFALNGLDGEDVWLLLDPGDGSSLRFAEHVEFDGAIEGVSFGRWPNAQGNLYPMITRTLGDDNSGPRPPQQIVISELMYNPVGDDDPDELEFIEIYNTTAAPIDLTGWRLRKQFDYDFGLNTIIDAQQAIVITAFDPSDPVKLDAFRTAYAIGPEVVVLGNPNDSFSDSGERIQLQRPGTPPLNDPLNVPYTIEDEIDYLNSWQPTTNDQGDSLNRTARAAWGNDPASWYAAGPTPGSALLVEVTEVTGRYVFYNNSFYDDESRGWTDANAIASDKVALRPGEQAGFDNYTSYVNGINGIIVDVDSLAIPGGIDAGDFTFKVGTDNTPANWPDAPAPDDIDVIAGPDTTTRIVLTWPDHAIGNTWLEVTLLDTQNTGIDADDVFYFGNAIAETGNFPGVTTVDMIDVLATRQNPQPFFDPATIDNAYDFNRDSRVNAVDTLIARNHQTWSATDLPLLDLTAAKGAVAVKLDLESTVSFDWLQQVEPSKTESARKQTSLTRAIDKLLEDGWT